MLQMLVTCDGCGVRKGDSNHWWQIVYEGNDLGSNLTILPFVKENEIPSRLDLCSTYCVIQEVSKWMEGIIDFRRTPLSSVTESTGEDQQSNQ